MGVLFLFRYFQKRNTSRGSTEPSQTERSESSGEAQIESLRLDFDKAIAALKDSKLKGPLG